MAAQSLDDRLSAANRQAWDTLYGKTTQRVWGDRPIGFLPEYAPEIRAHLNGTSRVLDAACGEGRNLECLLRLEADVYACDSSRHALEKLPSWIRERVTSQVCDLNGLPFERAFFDFVLATDVIETL